MTTKKKLKEIRFTPVNEVINKIEKNLTFGSLVRDMRLCDEISQTELAKRLKVSRQFICAVELGNANVGIEFAKRVADALGYSPAPFVKILLQEQLKKYKIDLSIEVKSKNSAA